MQLSGELSKVSLPNLLQLARNGELTGKIALLQGTKTATIFVENGNIVHVESDMGQGRDALMELFLWLNGSFAFMEEDVASVLRTLQPNTAEDALEKLVRDGLAYVEQKQYLDQWRVTGTTVLTPTQAANDPLSWQRLAQSGQGLVYAEHILSRLDGRLPLAEALAGLHITRRAYVQGVYLLLAQGLASVSEPAQEESERVNLPAWVVARLKQDNLDISQSIVDMVIWVDRVKCWMYQVDVDFSRIVLEMEGPDDKEPSHEELFKELEHEAADFHGTLFGEAPIPTNSSIGATLQHLPGGEYYTSTTGAPPDELVSAPVPPQTHVAEEKKASKAQPQQTKAGGVEF